jgi:DNA-binding CsgD family transcriptional regulator
VEATLALVGRDGELAAIEALLDPDLLPATLLIDGEAGIGKTSICDAAVAVASERGFEVLITRPAAAEAELTLVGIGDLLEPVLERILPALPSPQAGALRAALLLDNESSGADVRALGIAFLSALRIVASTRLVLVLVDDVQWLDAGSAGLLRFAWRRLESEPLALLLARRVGFSDAVTPGLRSFEQLELEGLSAGALHRLLRERLELVLSRPALRRLHDLSAGNPFYALELGRALRSGTIRLERGEPLPPTLEALVGERIAALPPATRDALAVAAAVSRPTPSLVGPPAVLAPAVAAHVVALDRGDIRFTHPLLASAAYAWLDDGARRELHARLAAEVNDVEERARHLALAAAGPDESVATELGVAAASAHSRGAVEAAAELAEMALQLTPATEEDARHERTLTAVRYRFESGDVAGPRAVLEQLLAVEPHGPQRARALGDLARMHMFQGSRRRAVVLLRDALEEAGEDAALRAMLEERLLATLIVLRENLQEAWARARSTAEAAERVGDRGVRVRALAAIGFVGGLVGDPEAVAHLERAVQLESHAGFLGALERPSFNLAAVLMWRGELARARELFDEASRKAADAGDESSLAWTADNLAYLEFLAGNWTRALAWASEGDEIAGQTGQPPQQAHAKATAALVYAHLGDASAARAAAAAALELSGDEVAIGWLNAGWALGVLELGRGDPAAAHAALDPLCAHAEREGIGEPGTMRFVFDDVEALVALGRTEEATERLSIVEAHARRLDRPFALAASARCRGLLAAAAGDHAGALAAFDRALVEHARAPFPFDRARILLAQGVALRRARRKREARAAFEEAQAIFDSLGAALFAQRSRDELAQIGGRTSAGEELTPTERRVVELVAQGLTNRQVAAAAFVTPKTIEFHLRNIFRKLDIRSRAELVRRRP